MWGGGGGGGERAKREVMICMWGQTTYERNLPEPSKQRSPFVESIQDDPRERFGSAQGAGTQHWMMVEINPASSRCSSK